MKNILLTGEAGGLDLTAVKSAIESNISASDISTVISEVLGVSIGFVLLWWGARKVINCVLDAFRFGTISLQYMADERKLVVSARSGW